MQGLLRCFNTKPNSLTRPSLAAVWAAQPDFVLKHWYVPVLLVVLQVPLGEGKGQGDAIISCMHFWRWLNLISVMLHWHCMLSNIELNAHKPHKVWDMERGRTPKPYQHYRKCVWNTKSGLVEVDSPGSCPCPLCAAQQLCCCLLSCIPLWTTLCTAD